MKLRTSVTAAVLAGALALAGCSSEVSGTPSGADSAASVSAGTSGSSASAGSSDASAGSSSDASAGSGSDASAGSSSDASAGSSADEAAESSADTAPSSPATDESDPAESASAPSEAESSSSEPTDASSEPTTSSSSEPADPSTEPSDSSGKASIAGFAAAMQKGVANVTSMQGALTMKAGPISQSATFAQKLKDGKATAFDMKMSMDAQGQKIKMNLRRVGGKSYLGPAATLTQFGIDAGGKSWVLLDASSSNPVLSQMATQMDQAMTQTGVQQYLMMVSSASDLKTVGTDKVAGAPATHYRLVIDVSDLAAAGGTDTAAAQAAEQAGLTEIPLHVWLDGKNRPVKVVEKFTVQGQKISVLVKMGKYNQPVKIAAPAPKDVAKG